MARYISVMSIEFRRSYAPPIILAGSLAALAGAFIAQYGFDLQPCVLCIYQRWPYAVAAALAVLCLFLPAQQRQWALTAAIVALLVGGGIAGYHVGVEQHWWAGTAGCTGGATPATLEELRAQVMSAPVVRCDEVAFSLFGISMQRHHRALAEPDEGEIGRRQLMLRQFLVDERVQNRGRTLDPTQTLMVLDGPGEPTPLFDGEPMYAATFVREGDEE